MKILAIHEAGGQDITFQDDIAFALVVGGQSRTRISVYLNYKGRK